MVKQMKTPRGEEGAGKANQEVIREDNVLEALGDHEGLPLLFGVVINNAEPSGIVLKLHNVDGESITLSKAGSIKLLTEMQCLSIFVSVCSALKHLKCNNVILEKRESSADYFPVIIDFGKSRHIGNPETRRRKRTAGNSYIAPEVIDGRKETTASDVYSLGRMFKAVALCFPDEFYKRIRNVVKRATDPHASKRATVLEMKMMLEHLQK